MAFNFEEILSSIGNQLKTFGSTESIVGTPIELDGKTIIPVIKMKLGFGIGGGEGDEGGGSHGKHGPGGTGGGGGGGITVEPAAFITIKGDDISVLSPKGAKFEKLAEAVPGIVTKIVESAHGKGGKSEAPEKPKQETE
ncbi:sporulation protein [Candidatus Poribacteria bacterium]|nr:sporulation protein [Candidatus Poribacteria bacterium]